MMDGKMPMMCFPAASFSFLLSSKSAILRSEIIREAGMDLARGSKFEVVQSATFRFADWQHQDNA